MASQRLVSRLFLVAAVYGILATVPLYFSAGKIAHDYPPAITHLEYFYGFAGVALAWQFLFLIISRDPVRYRLAILPGILEKLGWGIAVLVLFLQGQVAGTLMIFGSIDLLMAAAFAWAFWATREN